MVVADVTADGALAVDGDLNASLEDRLTGADDDGGLAVAAIGIPGGGRWGGGGPSGGCGSLGIGVQHERRGLLGPPSIGRGTAGEGGKRQAHANSEGEQRAPPPP